MRRIEAKEKTAFWLVFTHLERALLPVGFYLRARFRRYQPCAIPGSGPLSPGAVWIVESMSGENSPLSIQRLFLRKNQPTKCNFFELFYDWEAFAERAFGLR